MQTGTVTIDGVIYQFGEDGVLQQKQTNSNTTMGTTNRIPTILR
jgi:hypothetical protein